MSNPDDTSQFKGGKTKKEVSTESASSSSKPGCRDGGVLLRLRVLKRSIGLKKKKSDKDVLYLGTVAMYRNPDRIVPVIKGRPTQLDIGKYCVKFDYGGVEHMHPDEVIACANLYHDQVRCFLDLVPCVFYQVHTRPHLSHIFLSKLFLISATATNDSTSRVEGSFWPGIAGDFTIVR